MKQFLFILFFLAGVNASAQTYHLSLLGTYLPFTNPECGNIAGYVDSTGREYALLTTKKGLTIVDVTTPTAPVLKKICQWSWGSSPSLPAAKEVKEHKGFAYMTSANGVLIADLRHLPDTTVPYHVWDTTVNGHYIGTVHTLHIDTTMGNLYLFWSGISLGFSVFDIHTNPMYPRYLGDTKDNFLFHDGYADNDTLYGAGYDLVFIFDMHDKQYPEIIGQFPAYGGYAHNCWPTKDKKHLMITNELDNGPIEYYDIHDLNNIEPLKYIYTKGLTDEIPHNTAVTQDDFATTAWYSDGLVVHDVKRPENIVEVARYEVYPVNPPGGFSGSWGVYPFLPSGNILLSNINQGLYVLGKQYPRACWLEGTIRDSVTLALLDSVKIELLDAGNSLQSDTALRTRHDGQYKTGVAHSGYYTLHVSRTGYKDVDVPAFLTQNGVLKIIDVLMVPEGYKAPEHHITFGQVPFSSGLEISYYLPASETAKSVKVWDAGGKLLDEITVSSSAGILKIGETYSDGVYFVKIFSEPVKKVLKAGK